MQSMLLSCVASRQGVMYAHLEPACANIPRRQPLTVPEQAQSECLLPPLFPQMTDLVQEHAAIALQRTIA
jgi:perosamine synthetase